MNEPDQARRKDTWDRVSIVTPLITGLLVEVVGGTCTGVYSCREGERRTFESQRQDTRRKYEVEVATATQQDPNCVFEIEAIEKCFPHPTGTDPVRQRAAIPQSEGVPVVGLLQKPPRSSIRPARENARRSAIRQYHPRERSGIRRRGSESAMNGCRRRYCTDRHCTL